MYSGVEEHVCRRIAETPVTPDPFPHQIVEGVFPQDYYAELLDRLPTRETYRSIGETGTVGKNAYRERFVCDLADIAADEMGADTGTFWLDLAAWMMHARFRDFLLQHHAAQVRDRFGPDARVNASVDARFVRDQTNFSIGPHTDSGRKLMSLLFYLPRDSALRHLGTSVYLPLEPDFRCEGGPHYKSSKFRLVSTAPYVPNTLLLFVKSSRSFHGVEPVQDKGVERNLLLYNIYVTEVERARKPRFRLPWRTHSEA